MNRPVTVTPALRALRQSGLRIIMVTGDSRRTAEAVARKLRIDHVEAEVLPEQKREVVRGLQTKGSRVAMAGDGVTLSAFLSPPVCCTRSSRPSCPRSLPVLR